MWRKRQLESVTPKKKRLHFATWTEVVQCIRAGWSTYLRIMARQYLWIALGRRVDFFPCLIFLGMMVVNKSFLEGLISLGGRRHRGGTFRFCCFCYRITSFLYKMRGAGCCFKPFFVEDKIICFTWIYFAGFAFENYRKPFFCGGEAWFAHPSFLKSLKMVIKKNVFSDV